jgi:hypothetical protein
MALDIAAVAAVPERPEKEIDLIVSRFRAAAHGGITGSPFGPLNSAEIVFI